MEYEYRRKAIEPSSPPQRLARWIRLKQYQVEVTFAVYMFTPTEKFVFWSVVFLIFSMTTIAAVLYLPQHIAFLIDRAWFYVNGGEGSGVGSNILPALKESLSLAVTSFGSSATAVAAAAKETTESVIEEL